MYMYIYTHCAWFNIQYALQHCITDTDLQIDRHLHLGTGTGTGTGTGKDTDTQRIWCCLYHTNTRTHHHTDTDTDIDTCHSGFQLRPPPAPPLTNTYTWAQRDLALTLAHTAHFAWLASESIFGAKSLIVTNEKQPFVGISGFFAYFAAHAEERSFEFFARICPRAITFWFF